MLSFADGRTDLSVRVDILSGSLTAICGPSGAGKTSLLRILAGLQTPDAGFIDADGDVWLDTAQKINRPPQQRSIGFVFQDYALFPNMTVRQNLQFASATPNDPLINELLERLSLQNMADRRPQTLSGGQRQRVALIRALVRRPAILLLDEPFSALDAATARQLRSELAQLHRQYGTTTLLVSHNPEDVLHLADQVLYLEKGLLRPPAISQSADDEVRTIRPSLITHLSLTGLIVHLDRIGPTVTISLQLQEGMMTLAVAAETAAEVQIGDRIRVVDGVIEKVR